ncbi:MAG: DUF4340 domain-containing protein [Butyrivibrio sp.]
MKRFKKICILGGILVVFCIITIIVIRTEEKKEKIKNTDEIILSVSTESVKSISWEYDETSLAFHKDDVWLYDDDENFPVNEDKINELISVFNELGASFIIEEVEDYGQYGLDDPTCTINFETDEQEYEVKLGAFSTMDSQRYVSIGDGNVYLVNTDPMDTFEIQLSDTIQNDELPPYNNITKLVLSGTENYTITYEENSTATYCADDHYFTTVNNDTVPLDSDNVEAYFKTLHRLDLGNYVSYNVTEEELAEWGLDTPELTVVMNYTETDEDGNDTDKSFTLDVGCSKEELEAKKAAEEAGEEYDGTFEAYIRINKSQIVYSIDESAFDTLMAVSYNDLRHDNVMTADFKDITRIDILLDGESYSVTSESKTVSERKYLYQGEEIDISDLQSKIEALSASNFTDEEPTGKEEISLTFRLDNENYPEVTVKLYRYDGSNCLAVLDGEPFGLISRTSVVDVIEAVNSIVLD